MKLFRVKTGLPGVDRMKEFLEDNYVCIGYTGIGDLEHAGKKEIRTRLILAGTTAGAELEAAADSLDMFVNVMQDGDYVLIGDGEWAYLGDLGDYFYAEAFDSAEDGRCHRRGVTWLKTVPAPALNPLLSAWIGGEEPVLQYDGPLPEARLELWITDPSADGIHEGEKTGTVDAETLSKALAVLKCALDSGDPDRRERAAIALLQYAK
ncbi:hypothetical protein [Paenibacillus jilunlii]|uniref:Uncharacterized protein n=1 Tax=Paenibacillus jilunlii TaxID=682956 RepID=A0A1G9GLN4_9BACL|nr:hypothetical protein [Paenibacillus jilunlii]KWX78650.1 hypothetical protein AML91_04975 [Paenibacillus jilunlii]SDL01522.1 hypothetical protein SAMN05216191_101467 [Paenibacillus jilunlii]